MDDYTVGSVRNLRRPKAYLNAVNINLFHMRNPWVPAWWSAAFPGFGYILLGSYIKGFALIVWELLINNLAHLNTAIYYSLLGQFALAKEIIHLRWFILYIPVYVFCIWSSYRLSVDFNKLSILADREDSMVIPVKISYLEICFLDKRHPWIAAGLSLVAPGLGHLYTHRLPASLFLMVNYILIVCFANVLPAIHDTLTGNFSQAAAVLNPQWFLFLPSLIGFAVYGAYVNTVEYNRLFEMEQARFLRDHYQKMPIENILTNYLGGCR